MDRYQVYSWNIDRDQYLGDQPGDYSKQLEKRMQMPGTNCPSPGTWNIVKSAGNNQTEDRNARVRAPGTKIAWIRRPVTADSVPSDGHLEATIRLLGMMGVHKRCPTRPAGIIPSEGCQSWLPQKQLANTECYMRGSRRQAVP